MASFKSRGLGLFFLCYIMYSCIYVARLNFSVASVLLEESGALTQTQIGIIGSIFSFTYAAFKFPAGRLGDRFSPNLLVAAGLLLTAFSNLIIGLFPLFPTLCVFWFLNACGQAVLWGPILRTLSESYPSQKAQRLCHFMSSSVAFGSIAGLVTASAIAGTLGAAMCFYIPAFISLLLGSASVIFFPKDKDRPFISKNDTGSAKILKLSELANDVEFRRKILPAFLHGIIKDNINVWIAIYFTSEFGIDVSSIAGYVFIAPLMGFAGRLLFPFLFRKSGGRGAQIASGGFAVSMLVSFILLNKSISPIFAAVSLGVLSAMISMINVHFLADFPTEYADRGGISTVSSMMDVFTYCGAGLGSLIFGVMIPAFGFNSMFIVWIIASALSAFFLIKFRDSSSN